MSEYLLSEFELHGVRYVIDPPLLRQQLKEEHGYMVYDEGDKLFVFCDIDTEKSGDWVVDEVRFAYMDIALEDDERLTEYAIIYKRALLARCKPQG